MIKYILWMCICCFVTQHKYFFKSIASVGYQHNDESAVSHPQVLEVPLWQHQQSVTHKCWKCPCDSTNSQSPISVGSAPMAAPIQAHTKPSSITCFTYINMQTKSSAWSDYSRLQSLPLTSWEPYSRGYTAVVGQPKQPTGLLQWKTSLSCHSTIGKTQFPRYQNKCKDLHVNNTLLTAAAQLYYMESEIIVQFMYVITYLVHIFSFGSEHNLHVMNLYTYICHNY